MRAFLPGTAVTKRRPPGKVHDAVNRAVAILTFEIAAEVTGLTEGYLRLCTNPDQRKSLSLATAARIDKALHERGEETVLAHWMQDQAGDDGDGEPVTADHLRRALREVDLAMRLVETGAADAVEDMRAASALMHRLGALALLLCDLADRQRDLRRAGPKLVPEQERSG